MSAATASAEPAKAVLLGLSAASFLRPKGVQGLGFRATASLPRGGASGLLRPFAPPLRARMNVATWPPFLFADIENEQHLFTTLGLNPKRGPSVY